MSTLVEIEAAVDALPPAELTLLYAHLGERLGRPAQPAGTQRLAALDALQARLSLDARKTREWQEAVRDARR